MNHDDNIAFMKRVPDKFYDLGIVDPQTGQDEGKKHLSRPYSVLQKNGTRLRMDRPHRTKEWDNAPPTQEYWDELFRVTKHQIVMCENYLHFDQKKTSAGRIVWNLLRENDFSSCQVMWTSLFKKIDYFEYMWNGMLQGTAINSRVQKGNKAQNEKRIHPSQKPVIVYRHLLRTYARPGDRILDTHQGSGSLAIACHIEGFDYTGIEIDEDIFNDAKRWLLDHVSQLTIA